MVPSYLNLDISDAKLSSLTYEDEFLNLILSHYGVSSAEGKSNLDYQLRSLLHHQEEKDEK